LQSFVDALDGQVKVTIATVGGGEETLGPFTLGGDANSELLLQYANRQATLDVSGAGAGKLTYGDANVELAVRIGGGARFTVPPPRSFTGFWEDPEEGFKELVTAILPTIAAQGSMEVLAAGQGDVPLGLFTLNAERADAKLTLKFANDQVTVSAGAGAAASFEYPEGHKVRLALGAEGEASFQLPGASTLDGFFEDPTGKLKVIVDKLLAQLDGGASLTVIADDELDCGLFQLAASSRFAVEVGGGEASLQLASGLKSKVRWDTSSESELSSSATTIDLGLDTRAGIHLSLAGGDGLEAVTARSAWNDPRGAFIELFAKLPERLLQPIFFKFDVAGGLSIPDVGKLRADGGIALELARDHARLKIGGNARLDLDAYRLELQLSGKLDAQVGDPFSEFFAPLAQTPSAIWAQPDQLQECVKSFLERFQGHARVVCSAGVGVDEAYPWARVREQLETWKIKELMGRGSFIVDFWYRPSDSFIQVIFDVNAQGSTPIVPFASLRVTSNGVVRLTSHDLQDAMALQSTAGPAPDLNLKALVGASSSQLDALEEAIKNKLASTTTVELSYKGIVLTASVEEMWEAIDNFRTNWNAAVAALERTGRLIANGVDEAIEGIESFFASWGES
jgi:hypothetical protein